MKTPTVESFFHRDTNTVTYLVWDPATAEAAIIDPVLDFDVAAGRTATTSADTLVEAVRDLALSVRWILETHVHADHLSAAPYLKDVLGGEIGIGAHVADVQSVFKPIYNLDALETDGSQFGHCFVDGETFLLGEITAEVLHTPGHTPACVSYRIGDAVFVGDTLFMPDYGTARTDFPGGDAGQLFDSIQRILSLPDETRLFMCHDYKAPGRDEYAWETTVADQRENNVHIGGGVSRESFVEMRESRDRTLRMPSLILPSIQVNLAAGQLPDPEANGTRYLKLPLNRF